MSEDFDNVLSILSGERQKASRKPARRSSGTKVSEETEAPSGDRGKRGRVGMKQVNASIPDHVKAKVFYHLKMETDPAAPKSVSDLIEELLTEWVDKKEKGK